MSGAPILPRQPFTLGELAEIGLTEPALRRLVRGGVVRAVLRAVFAAADLPDTIDLRVQAAGKVVKPHHVVTDRTAAWLHGVDLHVYAEHEALPPIEVCALRGHEPTTMPGLDGRTRDLVPEDVMRLNGVAVTTPLRTALDLGCCLHRRDAFAALVMIARQHGLTQVDYARALSRYRRRRGVVQLRELVGLVDLRVESIRECWVLLEILDAGLPKPEPQFWVQVDGVPTYRLDFAYKRRRVCVEYDGFEAHEKSPAQKEYDDARRSWLRDEGWTVIVVRRGDFTGKALQRWLAELSDALRPRYTNRRW